MKKLSFNSMLDLLWEAFQPLDFHQSAPNKTYDLDNVAVAAFSACCDATCCDAAMRMLRCHAMPGMFTRCPQGIFRRCPHIQALPSGRAMRCQACLRVALRAYSGVALIFRRCPQAGHRSISRRRPAMPGIECRLGLRLRRQYTPSPQAPIHPHRHHYVILTLTNRFRLCRLDRGRVLSSLLSCCSGLLC